MLADIHKEIVDTAKEIVEEKLINLNISHELNTSGKVYEKLCEISDKLTTLTQEIIQLNLQTITAISTNNSTKIIEKEIIKEVVTKDNTESTKKQSTRKKSNEPVFIPTLDTSDIVVNTKSKKSSVVSDINMADNINKLNSMK